MNIQLNLKIYIYIYYKSVNKKTYNKIKLRSKISSLYDLFI